MEGRDLRDALWESMETGGTAESTCWHCNRTVVPRKGNDFLAIGEMLGVVYHYDCAECNALDQLATSLWDDKAGILRYLREVTTAKNEETHAVSRELDQILAEKTAPKLPHEESHATGQEPRDND